MADDLVKKQLHAVVDQRSTLCCLLADGQIRKVDEQYDTIQGLFVGPPFHVHCRSLSVPWVKGFYREAKAAAKVELNSPRYRSWRKRQKLKQDKLPLADQPVALLEPERPKRGSDLSEQEKLDWAGLGDVDSRKQTFEKQTGITVSDVGDFWSVSSDTDLAAQTEKFGVVMEDRTCWLLVGDNPGARRTESGDLRYVMQDPYLALWDEKEARERAEKIGLVCVRVQLGDDALIPTSKGVCLKPGSSYQIFSDDDGFRLREDLQGGAVRSAGGAGIKKGIYSPLGPVNVDSGSPDPKPPSVGAKSIVDTFDVLEVKVAQELKSKSFFVEELRVLDSVCQMPGGEAFDVRLIDKCDMDGQWAGIFHPRGALAGRVPSISMISNGRKGTFAHEFGHLIDWRFGNYGGRFQEKGFVEANDRRQRDLIAALKRTPEWRIVVEATRDGKDPRDALFDAKLRVNDQWGNDPVWIGSENELFARAFDQFVQEESAFSDKTSIGSVSWSQSPEWLEARELMREILTENGVLREEYRRKPISAAVGDSSKNVWYQSVGQDEFRAVEGGPVRDVLIQMDAAGMRPPTGFQIETFDRIAGAPVGVKGMSTFDSANRSFAVQVSTNDRTPGEIRSTLSHEFAHVIDRTAGSIDDTATVWFDASEEEWAKQEFARRELPARQAWQMFRDAHAQSESAGAIDRLDDPDDRAYLDSGPELFARFYAQYLADVSGDQNAYESIMQRAGRSQWTEDDYRRMKPYFDKLLVQMGATTKIRRSKIVPSAVKKTVTKPDLPTYLVKTKDGDLLQEVLNQTNDARVQSVFAELSEEEKDLLCYEGKARSKRNGVEISRPSQSVQERVWAAEEQLNVPYSVGSELRSPRDLIDFRLTQWQEALGEAEAKALKKQMIQLDKDLKDAGLSASRRRAIMHQTIDFASAQELDRSSSVVDRLGLVDGDLSGAEAAYERLRAVWAGVGSLTPPGRRGLLSEEARWSDDAWDVHVADGLEKDGVFGDLVRSRKYQDERKPSEPSSGDSGGGDAQKRAANDDPFGRDLVLKDVLASVPADRQNAVKEWQKIVKSAPLTLDKADGEVTEKMLVLKEGQELVLRQLLLDRGLTEDEIVEVIVGREKFMKDWSMKGGLIEQNQQQKRMKELIEGAVPESLSDEMLLVQYRYTQLVLQAQGYGESDLIEIRRCVIKSQGLSLEIMDDLGVEPDMETRTLSSWCVPKGQSSVTSWLGGRVYLESEVNPKDVWASYSGEPILRSAILRARGELIVLEADSKPIRISVDKDREDKTFTTGAGKSQFDKKWQAIKKENPDFVADAQFVDSLLTIGRIEASPALFDLFGVPEQLRTPKFVDIESLESDAVYSERMLNLSSWLLDNGVTSWSLESWITARGLYADPTRGLFYLDVPEGETRRDYDKNPGAGVVAGFWKYCLSVGKQPPSYWPTSSYPKGDDWASIPPEEFWVDMTGLDRDKAEKAAKNADWIFSAISDSVNNAANDLDLERLVPEADRIVGRVERIVRDTERQVRDDYPDLMKYCDAIGWSEVLRNAYS